MANEINPGRVTIKVLEQMKSKGEKISMLTAYDYSFAKIIDEAGIDIILVGDSASNVMAGHETTLPITLDQMIYHASSVVRAVKRSLVVVDLPFGTYQGNSKEALNSSIKIMKESAFLINCARGGIVNEVALLDALKSNKIRAAGLDVYDDEPSTSSNPLFSLDNILLSPHIAGVTQEATIRMSKQAVQNVLDVFDDKVDPEVIINKNVL